MRRGFRTSILAAVVLSALPAAAAVHTRVQRTATASSVTTPNQPATIVDTSNDDQQSVQPQPVKLTTNGSAIGGLAEWGYGNAFATATAEPGILRAWASTEAQAVARPDSNVAGGSVATALAEFAEELTFTPAHPVYSDLLIINGVLLLTGDMSSAGLGGSGYVRVNVGGTGLATNLYSEWVGELTRQKSPSGVYSDWTPGAPVEIPFRFTVYADQPTEVLYWLSVYASSGASFDPCEASGGLCNVVQVGENRAESEYGDSTHTLTWHMTSATDWFETPVATSIGSSSGFDYEAPEAGSLLSQLAGIAALAWRRRRSG